MQIKQINKFIIGAILVVAPSSVLASQAGIVISKQDGTTKTACVQFDENSISGWQLLQKSGFNPISKNGFVVSIDGEGSKDNSEMSKDDPFWSYWKNNDGWRFQNIGSNYDRVVNGDVEGWKFGDGKSSPPNITFEKICAPVNKIENSGQVLAATSDREESTEITNPEEQKSIDTKTATTTTIAPSPEINNSINVDNKQKNNVEKTDVLANHENSEATFPEFNLKNVLTLFGIFILVAIVLIFTKISVKKHIKK